MDPLEHASIPAVACWQPYPILFSPGWLSHLFLDFFTGVIPFAYPLMRKGCGIEIFAREGTNGLRTGPGFCPGNPIPGGSTR